ncbi:cytochrome C biogenesis protein [Photobacterium proteolyticum]|uniref:Formate-dependent nitrite reductase complex subunit n=2 Tax=Photobacterium proteolyticum TaxID=1903952 RepID=A0A1Q9GSD9_9GAMM|nr:cytochrome C biogenesis protein [Photobacterium proteolyticum]
MVKSAGALKRVLLAMFFSIAGLTGSLVVYAQTAQVFVAADTELVESVETFQFRSIVDQNRAIALSKGLRCPQCQNQNLIESNSPVAKDLRLKVYQMVDEGKSDQEVIKYMTSRFGDFVLYKPKLSPSTYLLWGGPILLFLLFGSIAFYSIRKQAR